MTAGISFNIYVMSYQRYDRIVTKDLFEYCTYVVREEEADKYREAGVDNLLIIPKDCPVWNFMDTLWWTIWNTPEGEVVLLEVNPRVNASLPFVWKAGVNMLYLRCKNLLGDYSDIGQFQKIEFGLKMKKFYDSRYFL